MMLKILEVLDGKFVTIVCEKAEIRNTIRICNNGVSTETSKFFVSYPQNCFSTSDVMFITIQEDILLNKKSELEFV